MGFIWTLLVALSVVAAAALGRTANLTSAIAESAGRAVTLALGLVGMLSLWMGLLRIAEEAGIVRALARAVRPLFSRLFPEVPQDHPALGAMVMNFSANMLGLGNAATPFGIKAMADLQMLNPHADRPSDAQALFCALNTASLQLIPASVIAMRAAAGSHAPAEIIGATLVASCAATIGAVTTAKLLRFAYPLPQQPASGG